MARRRNNPDWGVWGWALAALVALLVPTAAVAFIKTHSNPPSNRAGIEAQAKKWGPIFGVPVSTIIAISKIESAWRPDTVNYSVRSIPLGGAWGPLQMTRNTGNDWAKRLAKHSNASVRAVAARWKGDGAILTKDLELAVMLSTAFLGALQKEFGTFPLVAGAYHQGAGKIRSMLKAGIKPADIPAQLPPKGKQYVVLANAAQKAVTA